MRRDALFAGGELRVRLEVARKELVDEIHRLDSAAIMQPEPDKVVEYLVSKHHQEAPRLHEDKTYIDEPGEANVDVSQDWDRAIHDRSVPFYITGTSFTFHIPYEGDEEFWFLRPSTFSSITPEGKTTPTELLWTFVSARAESPAGRFETNLAVIRQYLGWTTGELDAYNASLPELARGQVHARRARLMHDAQVASELGYPIRRRSDAPQTYSIPVRPKRVVMAPEANVRPAGWKPEPTLSMEIYEEVLRVITNMVEVMERSPEAFREMDEPGIRTHFLVQLNGQFEGGGTAETFNGAGKTDILLRVAGRVVFVAECKFWDGPQSLVGAIDQLRSYLSWHDTKVAVLLFNRGRDLSRVASQLSSIVSQHPSFVANIAFDSEIGHRVRMRHPGDNEREIILTVLVFQIPR